MPRQPRFPLGQTLITPQALALLTHEEVIAALGCHVVGEWGNVERPVADANERAVANDEPVVSAHHSRCARTPFFICTAADRSLTTVFLPGDR